MKWSEESRRCGHCLFARRVDAMVIKRLSPHRRRHGEQSPLDPGSNRSIVHSCRHIEDVQLRTTKGATGYVYRRKLDYFLHLTQG
jgi:hypothetical protein